MSLTNKSSMQPIHICLSSPYDFLGQRFHNLDSEDLGLWALGIGNDCKVRAAWDTIAASLCVDAPLDVKTRLGDAYTYIYIYIYIYIEVWGL